MVSPNIEWTIGDVVITKVVERESRIPAGGPVLPLATLEDIRQIDWLEPTWLNDRDEMNTSVHSLLVQTPTQRIVIDTGVGNDKNRAIQSWHHLQSDFLERFEQVWPRESVDAVICTHLHIDHVGWNTMWLDGRWVPTFPHARYYFVRAEYEHWRKQAESPEATSDYSAWAESMIDGKAVYADSIKPIADAGLITFVESSDEITPEISLRPTPGHTPGHASVVIASRGEQAVVSGDLLHFACQIAHPEWSASLDFDQTASAQTRATFLANLADTDTLLIGTHFGPPTAGYVRTDGAGFRLAT